MDVLLVVLHVLFFVPVLVRLAHLPASVAGGHGALCAEVAGSLRRPVLVVHGAALGLLWAALGFALRDGRIPREVTVRGVLGVMVALGSVILMTWSITTFRSWRLLPQIDAGHQLCTTGPYGIVRHPIYLALDLLAVGTAVSVPTLPILIATAALVVAGDRRARLEEQALLRAFGDDYRDYMTRVPRTLPFRSGRT